MSLILDLIYVVLESVCFSGSTERQLGVFQLEDQLNRFLFLKYGTKKTLFLLPDLVIGLLKNDWKTNNWWH